MAEKRWERLYQDVTTVLKPLVDRRDYFGRGLVRFREKLETWFFDSRITDTLTEDAGPGTTAFDFSRMEPVMRFCLANEDCLSQHAASGRTADLHTIDLVKSLDCYVLQDGLFQYDQSKAQYALARRISYPAKAQNYLHQFAFALSLYRTYLGVFNVYVNALHHAFLDAGCERLYLEQARVFRDNVMQQPLDESSLLWYQQQASQTRDALVQAMERVPSTQEAFNTSFALIIPRLVPLFDCGAKTLSEAYAAFPNQSITFAFRDTPWHILLKELAANLFHNQYSYSTMGGTIDVSADFLKNLLAEVTRFQEKISVSQMRYKMELLDGGIGHYEKVLRRIRVTSIEMTPSSPQGFFGSHGSEQTAASSAAAQFEYRFSPLS